METQPQLEDCCEICGQPYEDHRKSTDQCPIPLEISGASSRWNESTFKPKPVPPGIRRIRDFFDAPLDGREQPLTDNEIEHLIGIVMNHVDHQDNIGEAHYLKRLQHNPLEQAFHDEWLKENEPRAGINYGYGTLQDLFMAQGDGPLNLPKCLERINSRDRRIVASVIQWLGTNCGMGFLGAALRRCGYRITEIKK